MGTHLTAAELIDLVLDQGSFCSWDQPPAQGGIGSGHAQGQRRTVRRQAIAGQRMAQIRQFFRLVHGMF